MRLKRIVRKIATGLSDAIEVTIATLIAVSLGNSVAFVLMHFGVSSLLAVLIITGSIATAILIFGYLNGRNYPALWLTEADTEAEESASREELKLAEDPNSELWKTASSNRNEW